MTYPKKPTGIPAFVGEHIRALRLEKRLSLKRMHRLGGPTASTLSAIENGKNGFDVGTLIQIARVLDVHPSALLPDEKFEALKWGAIVDEPQPTQPTPRPKKRPKPA